MEKRGHPATGLYYQCSNGSMRTYIKPELLPDLIITDSVNHPAIKINRMKRNLSPLYSSLFIAGFGGRVGNKEDKFYFRERFNERDGFHPDVVEETLKGTIWTEVKAVLGSDRRAMVPYCQIQNYSATLLDAIENGQVNPLMRLAIFGYSKHSKRSKLGSLDNDKLKKRIAHETNWALVLPINLAYYVFMHPSLHQMDTYDHKSSNTTRDEEQIFRISGSTVTSLLAGQEGLKSLLKDYYKGIPASKISCDERLLCLDNLSVRTYPFPADNIFLSKYKLKPFNVVHIEDRKPKLWLESFRENHAIILGDLNIEDLSLEERVEAIKEPVYSGEEIDDPLPF